MIPLTIKPDPPFDFDLSAAIFSEGDAQIRRYEKRKFWQVIRVNNKLILITVTAPGTVEEPELSVNLGSDNEISNADAQKAVEIIRTIFNMDIDLNSFYEDIRNDKIISELAMKLRGLKSPTTPTVFESLIDSIIEQQISLNVAHSFERNLIKSFGDTLNLDGDVYYGKKQSISKKYQELLQRKN